MTRKQHAAYLYLVLPTVVPIMLMFDFVNLGGIEVYVYITISAYMILLVLKNNLSQNVKEWIVFGRRIISYRVRYVSDIKSALGAVLISSLMILEVYLNGDSVKLGELVYSHAFVAFILSHLRL